MPERMPAGVLIGIDVGGTHTDVCLADGNGLQRAKALTTHGRYTDGILDAVEVAAGSRSMTTGELLGTTHAVVLGTTIVTNSVTELRGARVGVITTTGFRDTFHLLGGARKNIYDDHQQRQPPDLVHRWDVTEVDERVGSNGDVLVPLDETGVRNAVRRLRQNGVETIAICFLWAFKHPDHERRAAEIVQEEWPGVFVTTSSEIHPVIREYERFMTAALNCFCQPAAESLLSTVERGLREHDFEGRLSIVSGAGGAISTDMATRFPILLLGSGPTAGVTGATFLGEAMDEENLIVGDMGGTSFDTCLVQDGSPTVASRIRVGEVETGLRLVDVISIGTGGGSIAWADQRGVPRVGPSSAGSLPGPACYGRGGVDPTVTDAAVVLGFIDVHGYLGGRMELDREASTKAFEGVFHGDFGWTAEDVALGIMELTATNMAHALRSVSIERGHDPRDFLLVAYGGMLPLFAARICDKLGMSRAVVPRNSSVFSAFGTLVSDYVRRYTVTIDWELSEPERYRDANAARSTLLEQAVAEAVGEGVNQRDVRLRWGAECRFQGQVYEVELELPDAEFRRDDADRLAGEFPRIYERAYGKGAAWRDTPVTVVNLTLTVSAPRPKPSLPERPLEPSRSAEGALSGRRPVRTDATTTLDLPIFTESGFVPGMVVDGPAIIDQQDSTLFVPEAWSATRDQFLSFVISRANDEAAR